MPSTKVKSSDQTNTAFITTGTSPNFVLTIPGQTTIENNEFRLVNFHDDAVTAVTINVNSIGAKALVDEEGNAITAITADQDYRVKRDASQDKFVAVFVPGGGASIDDGAYGASRSGDTTKGASRNALYNKFESIIGGSGSWSKTARTGSTVYQAGARGGFVVYYSLVQDGGGGEVNVYSDASNPPTTLVGGEKVYPANYGTNQGSTVTVPILPNMYYKVSPAQLQAELVYDFYEIGGTSISTGMSQLVLDSRVVTQYADNNYTMIRSGAQIILCNRASAYAKRSGNVQTITFTGSGVRVVQSHMIYNTGIYLKCGDANTPATFEIWKGDTDLDISVVGNRTQNYTITGYTWNADDLFVGGYNNYIYVRRSGTDDIRRFTDSGTALVYVDTIQLPVVPTSVFVNDNGYFIRDGTLTTNYDFSLTAGLTAFTAPNLTKKTDVFSYLSDTAPSSSPTGVWYKIF